MTSSDLSNEQARQTVDLEQAFATYRLARADYDHRFRGAMSWKRVGGKPYLYRKRSDVWRSLGPRSPETEHAHREFHAGRDRAKDRLAGLAERLDRLAPVNRALLLNRLPLIAARTLRALDAAHLLGRAIVVVGTHAIYAYERLLGVQIGGGYLATGDVDLLFDARVKLNLLMRDVADSGLIGILQRVDRSFSLTGENSFRAVNRDGFMVDLVQPVPSDPMTLGPRHSVGTGPGELHAVEIEGLAWLLNSPKVSATVVDQRGYPLHLTVPDPRAFALHKMWLARRPDRDPAKRGRDLAQARLVAELVKSRMPHLGFDDPALDAMPKRLRAAAGELLSCDDAASHVRSIDPDW